MNRKIRQSTVRGAILAAALLFAGPVAAFGQGGPGYLFNEPKVSLKFETGYSFLRASSDVFDFIIAEHTLERRDFDSPYLGGEFGLRLSPGLDLALGVGYQGSSTGSEFREWVDDAGLPITQVTELSLIPVTVGLKYYLMPRGRRIGRFAWIPRTVAPFLGAGVGLVTYNLRQYGDFVDFETDEIFYDDFRSDRSAFLGRVSAGVEVSLNNHLFASFEGRYGWANAEMSGDFVGFDRIDLNGLQLVGGIAVRF